MAEEYGSILTYKREKARDFTEDQEYRIKALAESRVLEAMDGVDEQIKRLSEQVKRLEKEMNGEGDQP